MAGSTASLLKICIVENLKALEILVLTWVPKVRSLYTVNFTSKQQMLNSKNVEISMFSKKRKTPEIRSFLVDDQGLECDII